MSVGGLFDNAAEQEKDQQFRQQHPRQVTDSFFKAGIRGHYHKSDEEYPALHAYQLYPGLVVEVVMPNPFSLVKPGHVEPVLTRVHSINCFGEADCFSLGIGGFSRFADFTTPPRCFPQRASWGVVGDPARIQAFKSVKVIHGTLMDVDNITIHASDHPQVRVVEREPNKPAKVHKVFVGQLGHNEEWRERLAQERVEHQLSGQYPNWWQPPVADSEQSPVATVDTQGFAFAQAQRIRILQLKAKLAAA